LSAYVPIQRQIRFDSASGDPETPMWLIHWAGVAGEAAANPIVPVADIYSVDRNVIVYFRNP